MMKGINRSCQELSFFCTVLFYDIANLECGILLKGSHKARIFFGGHNWREIEKQKNYSIKKQKSDTTNLSSSQTRTLRPNDILNGS